jgi:hypothetical protein
MYVRTSRPTSTAAEPAGRAQPAVPTSVRRVMGYGAAVLVLGAVAWYIV